MNKVVLITGGAKGIGAAIARELARQKYDIVINYLTSEEKALQLQEEILKVYDVNCMVIKADVSKEDEVERMVRQIEDSLGGVDILINNAAIDLSNLFHLKTADQFRRTLDVNVVGAYNCSKAVSKHMLENKIEGHILNVSSSSSMRPSWGPYQLSKRALNGMTLGFAKRLAPYGITVNGLAPGVTMTPMASNFVDDPENLAYFNPIRRAETPEEIANLAIFLTSNLGTSIVGDTVMISGGSGILSESY